MLKIYKDAASAANNKNGFTHLCVKPSTFANGFISGSLDTYGVVKAPKEIAYAKGNIPMAEVKTSGSVLTSIFARPDHKNTELFVRTSLKNLSFNNDINADPEMAALILKTTIEENIDLDIDISLEGTSLEDISSAYANLLHKQFVPIELERLLKLFSLFYGREVPHQQMKFIAISQLNLRDLEQDISLFHKIDFYGLRRIVAEVSNNYTDAFSSNNLFNKILEVIHSGIVADVESAKVCQNDKKTIFFSPKKEIIEESSNFFSSKILG